MNLLFFILTAWCLGIAFFALILGPEEHLSGVLHQSLDFV